MLLPNRRIRVFWPDQPVVSRMRRYQVNRAVSECAGQARPGRKQTPIRSVFAVVCNAVLFDEHAPVRTVHDMLQTSWSAGESHIARDMRNDIAKVNLPRFRREHNGLATQKRVTERCCGRGLCCRIRYDAEDKL